MKALTFLVLLFLMIDIVQAAPEEFVPPDEVLNAVDSAQGQSAWLDQYLELLALYDKICYSGAAVEKGRVTCDQVHKLINSETEKKLALNAHLNAVFHRQGVASNIILALVAAVVLSGIALAAYQLRVAAINGSPQTNTDLEASASKVRITSSSVGLIILLMSLIFLYLYLKEVYGISVVTTG